ncbi:MAG TPA: NADH-quinone reductase [Treponema sp.]|nr:NADH-quinone reductase [Treponema sp.]
MSDTSSRVFLSSSPHFTAGQNTQQIMAVVLISLLPECIYGVMVFGLRALVTILVSVASCVAFEALFQKICRQKITVDNLSAAVTGVLLALVVSSSVPAWMVVIGAFVAVVIAKGIFGGIGANVFNPALTGRGFMVISFGAAMSRWAEPHAPDAISSATVLSQIRAGSIGADDFNFVQYFIGNRAGCIGETSALLILISFVFLLAMRIIDWRAPVAMVATVAAGTFISALAAGRGAAGAGADVLMALLTGGVLFGATFMVTDYATAPVTKPGRLVFGFGCGLITFLIRRFGGYPEGVMFSILIMNTTTYFLNRLTSRKYGYGSRARHCDVPAKTVTDFDVRNAAKEESK